MMKPVSKKRFLHLILANFAWLLLINGLVLIALSVYKDHLQNNLKPLNYQSSLVNMKHPQLQNGSKKIIFYRHDCTTCIKDLPAVYIINKLTFQRVTYLDTRAADSKSGILYNRLFAENLGVNYVPSAQKLEYHSKTGVTQYQLTKLVSTPAIIILIVEMIFFEALLFAFGHWILARYVFKIKLFNRNSGGAHEKDHQ